MPVLYEPADPALFARVKDRNLEQQYILLQTVVDIALGIEQFRYTPDVLYALHAAAANFLHDEPGRVRGDHVHINASSHIPPPPDDVGRHLDDFFDYLNTNRGLTDSIHLAAFAMWRLTWIHPFGECNGRTARAFCLMVLCIEKGFWLPGAETIISLMSELRNDGYRLLAKADEACEATGAYDLAELELFLKKLTVVQLQS